MVRGVALTACALAGLTACNAIFGVDDYVVEDGTATGADGGGGAGELLCVPNEVRSCYEAPPETEGMGPCQSGSETCLEDGSGFGPCEAQVVPTVDDCSSDDDLDCNGFGCGEVIWSRIAADDGSQAEVQRTLDVAATEDAVAAVGYYVDALRFGGSLLRSNEPSLSGFIGLLSPVGNVTWPFGTTGDGLEIIDGVAFDSIGNLVVVGSYVDQLIIGPNTSVGDEMTRYGFVAGISRGMAVRWVRLFTGSDNVSLREVAAHDGQIVVVGSAAGTVNIDATTYGTATEDWLVLALDEDGNTKWVASHESSGDMRALDVAMSPQGIVVGGDVTGSAMIGSDEIVADNQDALLIHYTLDGTVVGQRHFASTEVGQARDVDWQGEGVVVGGAIEGSADLGNGMVTTDELDGFIMRLNAPDLSTDWVRLFSGPGDDAVQGVAVDDAGEIPFAGIYRETLTVSGNMFASAGEHDIFVGKLSTDGDVRHIQSYGGPGADIATSVTLRPTSREFYVGGYFGGPLMFGNSAHTPQGEDGFLVLFAP